MALNGKQFYVVSLNVCLMVFNATFNNISVYIKAVSFIEYVIRFYDYFIMGGFLSGFCPVPDLIVNTLIKKECSNTI
jgi:hypothetical protein